MTTRAKKIELSIILVMACILGVAAFIDPSDPTVLAQAAWHFASFCVWPLALILTLVILYWCLEDEIEDFVQRHDARCLERSVNRRRTTFRYTSLGIHHPQQPTSVGWSPRSTPQGDSE